MVWTYVIGAIIIIAFILYKYFNGNKSYWPKHGVQLFDLSDAVPFWDRALFRQPFHDMELKMYKGIKQKYGPAIPYVGIMEFRTPTLILLDLELIKHVLVKDFDHFVDRRTIDMKKADPYLSEMLVNQHGQEWKNMRSTLSPTFSTGRIRRMFEIFNECGEKMNTFIQEETEKKLRSNNSGEEQSSKYEMEFRDLCSRYTMDVIASAAFGVDSKMFKDSNAEFAKMGKRIQNQFTGTLSILKLIIAVFAPKLLNLLRISILDQEATKFFAGVTKSSVEYRNKTGSKRDDFLQLLIETQSGELKADEEAKTEIDINNEKNLELQKATKVQLTDFSLTAQSLLFFLAGFDTTETLLVLAMYELAVNQDVQDKLFKQIDTALKENDGKMSYDVLMGLQYLDMIVTETLRKYPIGIRLERKCTRDYTFPGTDLTLKKDQVVIIPVMGIHRDEEYYPDPEKFDPERFSPENKVERHPYTYMPFGQGPRSCIAMRFALVEAKGAIAHIIHKYKLEPCSKTKIPMKFALKLALKPEGGLWLNVKQRI